MPSSVSYYNTLTGFLNQESKPVVGKHFENWLVDKHSDCSGDLAFHLFSSEPVTGLCWLLRFFSRHNSHSRRVTSSQFETRRTSTLRSWILKCEHHIMKIFPWVTRNLSIVFSRKFFWLCFREDFLKSVSWNYVGVENENRVWTLW